MHDSFGEVNVKDLTLMLVLVCAKGLTANTTGDICMRVARTITVNMGTTETCVHFSVSAGVK